MYFYLLYRIFMNYFTYSWLLNLLSIEIWTIAHVFGIL